MGISEQTAELLDSALVGGTPSPIMMTQTIFFLFLSSCSAAPAFFDYWDQMIQNNTILDRIEDYRSYLPESLNSYLNKTLDDGLEMAYDLYDDFKEEVLEKSTQQVDAMTDLMKNFISRVLSIHKDIGNVLEQDPALTDEEIQEKYINCQFGVNPVELGCTDGLVFDHTINKCVHPDEGPTDCKCWYSCEENSTCPDSCNTDCTCP